MWSKCWSMAGLPVEKFADDTQMRCSIWRGILLFSEMLESKQCFFLGFWSVELDPELTLVSDKAALQPHRLWGKWEAGLKMSWLGLYNGSSIAMPLDIANKDLCPWIPFWSMWGPNSLCYSTNTNFSWMHRNSLQFYCCNCEQWKCRIFTNIHCFFLFFWNYGEVAIECWQYLCIYFCCKYIQICSQVSTWWTGYAQLQSGALCQFISRAVLAV